MSRVPDLSTAKEDPYKIPIVMATKESLRGYATIVTDFAKVKVEKTPWPVQGWRKARDGTDILHGEESGEIYYKWEGNTYTADKVIGCKNEIGFIHNGSLSSNTHSLPRTHVLAWESTYHPDCGEVFFPKTGDSFVVVLALPGDDLKLEDFVAFYCDGTFGIQTHPYVWHLGMFSTKDNVTFLGKQGLLHACVAVDILKEFGRLIYVPLTKPEE
ncbi:uncharacterized protein LOC123539639 [Mercenaria mercenaria]|uniref:uncharacterized protein LOC123539639 n=1 Tax=Mercenaria mercenaria TaxID=6596 RepID=UPI001E1D9F60|nr:uncharacterized protein LOC123539639 [Mercenaria mercenaria]